MPDFSRGRVRDQLDAHSLKPVIVEHVQAGEWRFNATLLNRRRVTVRLCELSLDIARKISPFAERNHQT